MQRFFLLLGQSADWIKLKTQTSRFRVKTAVQG